MAAAQPVASHRRRRGRWRPFASGAARRRKQENADVNLVKLDLQLALFTLALQPSIIF